MNDIKMRVMIYPIPENSGDGKKKVANFVKIVRLQTDDRCAPGVDGVQRWREKVPWKTKSAKTSNLQLEDAGAFSFSKWFCKGDF